MCAYKSIKRVLRYKAVYFFHIHSFLVLVKSSLVWDLVTRFSFILDYNEAVIAFVISFVCVFVCFVILNNFFFVILRFL